MYSNHKCKHWRFINYSANFCGSETNKTVSVFNLFLDALLGGNSLHSKFPLHQSIWNVHILQRIKKEASFEHRVDWILMCIRSLRFHRSCCSHSRKFGGEYDARLPRVLKPHFYSHFYWPNTICMHIRLGSNKIFPFLTVSPSRSVPIHSFMHQSLRLQPEQQQCQQEQQTEC